MSDQAASLRQWAADNPSGESVEEVATDATKQVVVLGLPAGSDACALAAAKVFHRWSAAGRKWVGDASEWRVIPVATDYPELASLVSKYPRWALWVGDDINSFYRAYQALKAIQQVGGPKRLIALHAPISSRRGLLGNLQHVARKYFDIELLVFLADGRP